MGNLTRSVDWSKKPLGTDMIVNVDSIGNAVHKTVHKNLGKMDKMGKMVYFCKQLNI